MQVTFRKLVEQRLSTWDALRSKRTRVPGATMALGRADMPHDLVQLVVEGTLGLDRGFWGLIAAGATFRSTGRKRTRPGRAVIAANRTRLAEAEALVGKKLALWHRGKPTAVARPLDDMKLCWDALDDSEELVIEWPSLRVCS